MIALDIMFYLWGAIFCLLLVYYIISEIRENRKTIYTHEECLNFMKIAYFDGRIDALRELNDRILHAYPVFTHAHHQ